MWALHISVWASGFVFSVCLPQVVAGWQLGLPGANRLFPQKKREEQIVSLVFLPPPPFSRVPPPLRPALRRSGNRLPYHEASSTGVETLAVSCPINPQTQLLTQFHPPALSHLPPECPFALGFRPSPHSAPATNPHLWSQPCSHTSPSAVVPPCPVQIRESTCGGSLPALHLGSLAISSCPRCLASTPVLRLPPTLSPPWAPSGHRLRQPQTNSPIC